VKINVGKHLNDFEGKPIMSGDQAEQFHAQLGHIISVALLTDTQSDQSEPGGKKFHRWQLAKGVKNALESDEKEMNVNIEDLDLIKKRIGMVFQTRVLGPAFEALEG